MANDRETSPVWKRLLKIGWQNQILPGIAVIALVIIARSLGLFQGLEWKTLDSFLRLRPAESPDERLLIVGIDGADIQQIGTYPIPDEALATLLQTLSEQNPRAIGMDIYRDSPVEPGSETLTELLATSNHIFGIEKITPDPVFPPPALPPERIGFVDFPLDRDGFVRRAYLGAFPPINYSDAERFRFSLALKLAKAYLAETGLTLQSGHQDPGNMRFGDTELFRFRPSSGGYINIRATGVRNATGVQILLNPRSGKSPFAVVSMTDVLAGRVDADLIRDRIVLVGITSHSVKDFVNSAAVNTDNPGSFYGVEMQAHVTSQILSAILNERPLLRSWSDPWEYMWIVLWGGVGLLLIRQIRRLPRYVLLFGLSGLGLAIFCLSLLWLGGWWVPLVPPLVVFAVNGGILPVFYLYDQTLRSRIDERQRVIEQTYDAIHSGPLQRLALLLKQQETLEPYVASQLDSLNQELREVYNRLQQESLPQEELVQLGNQRVVDLRSPLHQVLYEVYTETLRRDFPGFASIKFQVVKFEPLQVVDLEPDDKRSLCRFLEEAICNVGKHAVGAKRLTVLCLATETENLIRVADNGKAHKDCKGLGRGRLDQKTKGHGTQQALALARRLKGNFQRASDKTGTYCELRWPLQVSQSWWR